MRFKIGLIVISVFVVLSCDRATRQSTDVYIKGRVVNPKNNYIAFSRNPLRTDVDTISFISKNVVEGTLKNVREALYAFYLDAEMQMFYLKPGDSLLFHINTDEFDESLSFSGDSGFENNLLNEMFLINEKETEYFFKKIDSIQLGDFLKKLDSFLKIKQEQISKNTEKIEQTTEKFRKILSLKINATQYRLKEEYYARHRKEEYPKGFFDYRDVFQHSIADINIMDLLAAADVYIANKLQSLDCSDEEYENKLIESLESNIADQKLRDVFLTYNCNYFIKREKISDTLHPQIRIYFSKIQDRRNKNILKRIIKKVGNFKEDSIFPSIELMDINNHFVLTDTVLANKKVLLSFWQKDGLRYFKNNLKKLKKLHQKYPNMVLLMINLDKEKNDWKREMEEYKLGYIKFYRLARAKDIERIRPFHPAQVYLVDGKIIKETFVNIYDSDFEAIVDVFVQN